MNLKGSFQKESNSEVGKFFIFLDKFLNEYSPSILEVGKSYLWTLSNTLKPYRKCSHFRSHFSLFKASVNLQVTGNEGFNGSGAGEGNRTLVASLEGWSFTTKLHPQLNWLLHTLTLMLSSHYLHNGGGGRIRTYVRSRGRIYSPLPLTTRPPLRLKKLANTNKLVYMSI